MDTGEKGNGHGAASQLGSVGSEELTLLRKECLDLTASNDSLRVQVNQLKKERKQNQQKTMKTIGTYEEKLADLQFQVNYGQRKYEEQIAELKAKVAQLQEKLAAKPEPGNASPPPEKISATQVPETETKALTPPQGKFKDDASDYVRQLETQLAHVQEERQELSESFERERALKDNARSELWQLQNDAATHNQQLIERTKLVAAFEEEKKKRIQAEEEVARLRQRLLTAEDGSADHSPSKLVVPRSTPTSPRSGNNSRRDSVSIARRYSVGSPDDETHLDEDSSDDEGKWKAYSIESKDFETERGPSAASTPHHRSKDSGATATGSTSTSSTSTSISPPDLEPMNVHLHLENSTRSTQMRSRPLTLFATASPRHDRPSRRVSAASDTSNGPGLARAASDNGEKGGVDRMGSTGANLSIPPLDMRVTDTSSSRSSGSLSDSAYSPHVPKSPSWSSRNRGERRHSEGKSRRNNAGTRRPGS
eukprot:g8949.t1